MPRSAERNAHAAKAGERATTLVGLAPVVDNKTRLLVLGSFPGAASLAAQEYYAHPRNQFWRVLSALFGVELWSTGPGALPYAQRIAAVRARGVGIWDVYARCVRIGSLDADIKNAELNDLPGLVARLPLLRAIAHNGGESARTMRITGALGVSVVRLPSTSPANASWSFERKLGAWRDAFSAAGCISR